MSTKKATPGRSNHTGIRPGYPVIGDAVFVADASGNRKARASIKARGWTYPTPEREAEALAFIAGRPPFRAAVDDARAKLLAENAELRRRLATVENDAAQWFRIATEARTEAEQFHARLAVDGFVAFTREQVEAWRAVEAEVERLRAAALPEGGQWHTVRGWMNGDRFQTYTSSAEGFLPQTGPTHLRRTWTGPPDAVDETEETGG